jgi:hypothetical protein
MPTPPVQPPLVIATVGLHASASTWVFNVIRELMIAAVGEDRVAAPFADRMAQLADQTQFAGKHVVLKSHYGSPELDAWLTAFDAMMVLSIRDPRDASISMAQRFQGTLSRSVQWLMRDCERLMRLADQNHTLLRYEDRFFDDAATVEQLAEAIGARLPRSEIETIFERYRADTVRAFAARFDALPPERLQRIGRFRMDRVTQIHEPHIGNGASGKWRALPPGIQNELNLLFAQFLDRFGYER